MSCQALQGQGKRDASKKKVKPTAKPAPTKPKTGLEAKTVDELKKKACKCGVVGYSSMRKADLIAAIRKHSK